MYDVEVGEPGSESRPAPMVEAAPVAAAVRRPAPAVRTAAPVPGAAPALAAPKAAPKPAAGKATGQPVITQLPGLVLRIEKSVGQPVKTGDTILIVESMKMDNAIVSAVSGTVTAILVKQGDQVQAGPGAGHHRLGRHDSIGSSSSPSWIPPISTPSRTSTGCPMAMWSRRSSRPRGHGRLNRRWISHIPGNLCISLVLKPAHRTPADLPLAASPSFSP